MEQCDWPLCDQTKGLIMWMRYSDAEIFMHCGEHHIIVERLADR